MSYGGGHFGFPIGIKSIKFVEDLPMIIPGQLGFNCPSCFGWSSTKNIKFVEAHPMNIHVQFGFNNICSF
jgi:hypothetical protein